MSAQVPCVNDDGTESKQLLKKAPSVKNLGETYVLQSVKRLAKANISLLFIIHNNDNLQVRRQMKNLTKFKKGMK